MPIRSLLPFGLVALIPAAALAADLGSPLASPRSDLPLAPIEIAVAPAAAQPPSDASQAEFEDAADPIAARLSGLVHGIPRLR